MKRYLLSIIQPDGPPPAPEALDRIMRDANAVLEDMKSTGAWVFNGGLHPPSTATVVQVKGMDVLLTDGPFAEGKEHVGGVIVIKVSDLDAALAWARRVAEAIPLPIEVRPFQD